MKIDFLIPGRRANVTLSPALVRTGVGGTEEAYINVSKQLAALGHGVSVYADCRDAAGRYDGVDWLDLDALDRRAPSDVLVTSELPALIETPYARDSLVYLWLHVHLDLQAVAAAVSHWHKIMPLSLYSRQAYAAIPDSRVFQTRNGIDAAHFRGRPVERVRHRIAYGSDYDRGLSLLLWQWPRIRAAVPDATLHVFYGWEMFEWKLDLLRRTGSPILQDRLALKERLLRGLAQDGVIHLDRIGHERVAEEFLAAELWAYPCVFPETSCITAMKAQAAGAIPVVFPTAALRETVRFGVRTAHDPLTRPDLGAALGDAWCEAVIGLLRDPVGQRELRATMIDSAQTYFDWSAVAREWQDEFQAALHAHRPAHERQSQENNEFMKL